MAFGWNGARDSTSRASRDEQKSGLRSESCRTHISVSAGSSSLGPQT